MRRWRLKISWIIVVLLTLTMCRPAEEADNLKGRVILWHSWSATETAVLHETLDRFQEIHPEMHILAVQMPEDQLLNEFNRIGARGLGPDLLIGNDSWIGDMAESGLIRPWDNTEQASTTFFNSRNQALTEYEDKIFGVPMSLTPYALYYNTTLVETPPESLDELLAEAEAGNRVAFVPRFEEAYWGIQTMGKGLFNNENQFSLAESGFTEWLQWLNDAQSAPGVILNVDDESLLELFATGQIAYYVGGPEKQAAIMAMVDEENPIEFSVVPLPQGPQGSAGPLLAAETILLYAYTSVEQAKAANNLAMFLVNQQQSVQFMRELDWIPANPIVRVDHRIYPITNGFARQARTAVVIPNEIPTDPLIAAGNRAYIAVLSGVSTPEEAVCSFGLEAANFQGYSTADIGLPTECNSNNDDILTP